MNLQNKEHSKSVIRQNIFSAKVMLEQCIGPGDTAENEKKEREKV